MRDDSVLELPQPPPIQNAIDHSESFAIIAVLGLVDDSSLTHGEQFEEVWRLNDQFRSAFEDAVAEASREVLGEAALPRQRPFHYLIGPSAQQLPTEIITLWDQAKNLRPILSDLADAYVVAEITRRVAGKLHGWIRTSRAKARTSIVLPAYVLARLCEDHVRQTYHPRAKLTTECFDTTPSSLSFGSYSSPAHPTGMEEYLVTVKTSRNVYSYAIDGAARVKVHQVKKGKRTLTLNNPALHSDECGN